MTESLRVCPSCRLGGPPDARFCPHCGASLDEGGGTPATSAYGTPRFFGTLAPTSAFVLAALLLGGAIVAVFAEALLLGIALLVLAASVFALFVGAARRDPANPVARASVVALRRGRAWTSLGLSWVAAWVRAGRDAIRIQRELRGLRSERRRVQLALGDAAYREDDAAIDSLRVGMQEIDAAMSAAERRRSESFARARRHVDDERLSARRTERSSVRQYDREQRRG